MNKQQEKILIVDDVSKNIQILGNILAQKDYSIAYAQNGFEALKICDMQDFDLILLDIMMPGIDGYEVCNRLKKDPRTKDIPIIFLTAKADMESIVKGFEIGGQEYITKPFNSAELLARVHTHLLLKKQKQELKSINQHLEELVKERTNQLEIANKKLAQLDQAKSNFLSLISHEMRTPLNGIIGLTQLLNQTNIDADQKEYLEYLTEVSSRLVSFSEIAMLITRLKTDKYNPDILPVSIDHLIETSINAFRKKNPDSLLSIHYEKPDNRFLILADSDLVMIGISMLLENAEKFAGPGPKLSISITRSNKMVHMHFIDQGSGFSDEAFKHIFQLFAAGDILHKEGSGLSLATLKLIVDVHKGDIYVKNIKPQGAKVSLSFPESK
ncbi:MAG: hybrid sensor histidine kinase/response regulator [Bacteroidales bacterium]|nr:hybrid sensor histidine kinase/response regulator [Bacteroidales bacterium]